jgi:hypothetical protein
MMLEPLLDRRPDEETYNYIKNKDEKELKLPVGRILEQGPKGLMFHNSSLRLFLERETEVSKEFQNFILALSSSDDGHCEAENVLQFFVSSLRED